MMFENSVEIYWNQAYSKHAERALLNDERATWKHSPLYERTISMTMQINAVR